jgi:hypothetical protein
MSLSIFLLLINHHAHYFFCVCPINGVAWPKKNGNGEANLYNQSLLNSLFMAHVKLVRCKCYLKQKQLQHHHNREKRENNMNFEDP